MDRWLCLCDLNGYDMLKITFNCHCKADPTNMFKYILLVYFLFKNYFWLVGFFFGGGELCFGQDLFTLPWLS